MFKPTSDENTTNTRSVSTQTAEGDEGWKAVISLLVSVRKRTAVEVKKEYPKLKTRDFIETNGFYTTAYEVTAFILRNYPAKFAVVKDLDLSEDSLVRASVRVKLFCLGLALGTNLHRFWSESVDNLLKALHGLMTASTNEALKVLRKGFFGHSTLRIHEARDDRLRILEFFLILNRLVRGLLVPTYDLKEVLPHEDREKLPHLVRSLHGAILWRIARANASRGFEVTTLTPKYTEVATPDEDLLERFL